MQGELFLLLPSLGHLLQFQILQNALWVVDIKETDYFSRDARHK